MTCFGVKNGYFGQKPVKLGGGKSFCDLKWKADSYIIEGSR